jgi:hypothetical protein
MSETVRVEIFKKPDRTGIGEVLPIKNKKISLDFVLVLCLYP